MVIMRIGFLTGAGISAESGIETFRADTGLWANHPVEEVAFASAWRPDNYERVLNFYNDRRRDVTAAQPNAAHLALAELESKHEVIIVTQNVDDLHERGGSTNVIHLHGRVHEARSHGDPMEVWPVTGDMRMGDLDSYGEQARPNIVFFHEDLPNWEKAENAVRNVDLFVVIGTSLKVWPANTLLSTTQAPQLAIIDPKPVLPDLRRDIHIIRETATVGVRGLVDRLMS